MRATIALLFGSSLAMPAVDINPAALKLFAPLPAVVESQKNPVTEAKVRLGRMLYYDARLSKGQDVSCNTCHLLDRYGVDEEQVSTGHKGQKGNRNAPTVYNAAGHFVQFWDGRAADVEEQAKGPVLNPVEMAMSSEKEAVAVVRAIPEYVAAFKTAFPAEADPVTFDNMARAIGAFERKLLTPSRWDRYLKGDKTALTEAEKAGFNKFAEVGCATCHLGPYAGGKSYQKLGLVKPWPHTSDPGRYAVTKNERDRMMFKVPSLRNIDRTMPYFHTGTVRTLEEAVRTMAEVQNGRKLSDAEANSIIVWLKTLTGDLPVEYIKAPVLPKSAKPAARRTG